VRIVHLIDSLDYGGAEQMVTSLATFQSQHGHSVRVLCLRDLGPQPINIEALVAAGGKIVTLEKPPGFHLGTLRKLAAYLKRERIDVVHTHNHLVHHYGAAAGRWAGTPAVLNTLHGSSSLQMLPFWAKALFWLACLVSDRAVSVCLQVDEILQKTLRLSPRKLCVIDNGIDLSRFLQIPGRSPSETTVFGKIGRMDPVKDHENLLKAFAILRKMHPHVRLRLLGDGTLRRHLEELARTLSITEDVDFEGFSLDTARFLSSIDVCVISSRSEGLPLTLLEAMGAARPIVATAVGEIPNIVGSAQCGWLCSPSNPDDLAHGMQQALLAPDRATVGVSGRNSVRERYSLARMAKDYDQLYKEILSGTPARSG
jgi:glycosyltransferase involved in cell wall biosynthesis